MTIYLPGITEEEASQIIERSGFPNVYASSEPLPGIEIEPAIDDLCQDLEIIHDVMVSYDVIRAERNWQEHTQYVPAR